MQLHQNEEGLTTSGGLFRLSVQHIGNAEKRMQSFSAAEDASAKSDKTRSNAAAKTSKPTPVAGKAPETLIDLAKVVSSKDAGPYEPKLDVMFKVTIPRLRDGKKCCAGGFMENDVHGSQQYIPPAELRMPQTLIEQL
ncbi:hypothetical protein AC578_6956 [Pseudocercospora eumusae]|uniref:Uncharacterized protein n=1 Tax=Pseudocercospora eumusae TaxID=321146 RepID=A0A139H9F0_9PEZI|nr:hypothetical protein AC578_6956 [Pseudocercospora eumusae]